MCRIHAVWYKCEMPRLWTATIEQHRTEVRDAVLDATAGLVEERGLLAVTMSDIAEHAGIGRATLYKYFPDLTAILAAWHNREVDRHLDAIAYAPFGMTEPVDRLHQAIAQHADRLRRHHTAPTIGAHLAAHYVTHGNTFEHANHRLVELFAQLVTDAQASGVRADVPATELATYLVHALGAASQLPSPAAVRRLVTTTTAALEPPR